MKGIGQSLIIKNGEAKNIFENIINNFHVQSVFAHQETGSNWTFLRDKEIRILFKKNKILFEEFPSNGVVRGLKDRNNWSKIRNSRMYKDSLESPSRLTPLKSIYSDMMPSKKINF